MAEKRILENRYKVMATFKPTLSKPTPQGVKLEKSFNQNMSRNGVKLNETDELLSEAEQSLKKKIFSLAKMEALVFSDAKLSAKYEEMAENGEEKYGYHYNETIQNMLFNDYVLNSPKYLMKYKQAIPKEKKRRDASGINQLKKAGEETMQHKKDITKPQKLAPTGLSPVKQVAENDEQLTKVQFLVNEKDPQNKDVFAYFPDDIHNGVFRTAYSHIGQHSSAHPNYAAESRPATPEEYQDLKAELDSLGYNLEVMNPTNETTGSASSGAYVGPAAWKKGGDLMEELKKVEETTTGGGAGGVGAGMPYYTKYAWGKGELLKGKSGKAAHKPQIPGGTIIQESNYLIETDGFEKYFKMLNEDDSDMRDFGEKYQATHTKSNQGLGVSEIPQSPERENKIKDIEDNTMLFLGQDIQHSPDDDVEIFHQDMTQPHTLIPHQDNRIPAMQADGIAPSTPQTPVGMWDKIKVGGGKQTPVIDTIEKQSGDGYGDLENMPNADLDIIKRDLQNKKLDNPNLEPMEESKKIQEKAKSPAQQRLFGMAHAVQKGELSPSKVGGAVKKIAKTVSADDVEDFASTKHSEMNEDQTTMANASKMQPKDDSMSNKMDTQQVQVGTQQQSGLRESFELLEELNNELNAYSIHHNKLKKMTEDKKPSSLVLKDRLGDENSANFKKDLQHSGTKEIIDVEKELQWKDQQTEVGKDQQKLTQDIEDAEIKATDAEGDEALKNVGDSANDKGDEIPKRNLTTKEQDEVNMYRLGQHSLVYDNEPGKRFEDRMKKDMGDKVSDIRDKQLEFRGKAPMYNKEAQPVQDTAVDKVQFDKEKSGWNEKEGLKEHQITGKYFDSLGRKKLIDFKLKEAHELVHEEDGENLLELNFDGLGNKYNNKVIVNESVNTVLSENKFYTNGSEVFIFKTPIQKLNENEQKAKKPVINEQFEKMKHLVGYNTKDFIKQNKI